VSQKSAAAMSQQQPVVELKALNEPAHGDVLEMVDDPEHNTAVIYIVNCAFDWVDERFKLADRLITSRALITQMREKSPAHARSLLLRDSERYLWGRSYVIQKVRDNGSSEIGAEAEAEFADDVYQTMKAGFMALNSIFGTNYGKSNPANPFSALGGGYWYDLGLKHYRHFDSSHVNEAAEPYRLKEADLMDNKPTGPRYRK
jgi:hypothetical protein